MIATIIPWLFLSRASSKLELYVGCMGCLSNVQMHTCMVAVVPDVERQVKVQHKVHGIGTYDYSEVKHVGLEQKVKIICPKHTWFFQTPHSHLKGEGCPCCAGRFPTDERTRTEVYSEIHSNKYDYSSMDLENVTFVRRQQSFTCKEHGVFKLTLSQHLHRGCPTCNS